MRPATPRIRSRSKLALPLLACVFVGEASAQTPDLPIVDLPANAVLETLGDVDGDGALDLIATGPQTLHVLLGDGLGEFAPPIASAAPSLGTGALRRGDFDGDGRTDVGIQASTVTLHLGTPTGAFTGGIAVPGALNTTGVAFGDVNGDGRDDVVSGAGAAGFRFHRSLGGGTFAPSVLTPTASPVSDVALGDVDGDGRDDVIVRQVCSLPGCRPVVVHLSLAGGLFSAGIDAFDDPLTGNEALLARDMDADGLVDLLLRTPSSWQLLPSVGAGAFAPAQPIVEATGTLDERSFTDADRDGLVDLFVTDNSAGTATWRILRQVPGHAFESVAALEAFGGKTALTGDIDGDGADDRVVSWDRLFAPDQVVALPGDGHGGLRAAWVDGGVWDPHVTDVDLDGYPDLLVMGNARLARGRSGGRLGAFEELGIAAGYLRVVDMNGDGWLDLVTSSVPGLSSPGDEVAVALASSPGVFVPDASPLALPEAEQQEGLEVGDLDGDGDSDVARVVDDLAAGTMALRTALNDGGGSLAHVFTSPGGASINLITLRLGDLDGDGDLDGLIAGGTPGSTRSALNAGDGSFGPWTMSVPSGEGGPQYDVVLADSDRDGVLDLHAGGRDELATWGLRRFGGLGDGTFGPGLLTPQGSSDLLGFGLVAGDADGDGDVDVFTSGTGLALYTGDGAGGFAAELLIRGPGEPNDGFRGALGDVNRDGVLDYVHAGSFAVMLPGDSPWTQLGASLAGNDGRSRLTGAGPLTSGSLTELLVEFVPAGADAWVVLGLSELSAPFKGGTLVPFPDLLVPVTADSQGEALVSATWPAGAPSGATFFAQAWLLGGAPASTTAVRAVLP